MIFALEDQFGTAGPVDEYSMAGKTDPLIITELMASAGIAAAAVEEKLEMVYALMAERGRIIFPTREIRPCVGVEALLRQLREEPEFLVGLVTGNIAPTAPLKLAAAGIDPSQFQVGAYGSDEKDRNLLPALAMRRATELTGHAIGGNNTIVIGDTPADILCARSGNARSLAVATGGHSLETLARYGPDHLLPNLADTETVMHILRAVAGEKADG